MAYLVFGIFTLRGKLSKLKMAKDLIVIKPSGHAGCDGNKKKVLHKQQENRNNNKNWDGVVVGGDKA